MFGSAAMDDETASYRNFKRLDILGLMMLISGVLWELGWTLNDREYGALLLFFNMATLAHLIGVVGAFINNPSEKRPFRLLLFQIVGCLVIMFLLFREDGLASDAEIRKAEVIRMIVIMGLVAVPALVYLTHLFQWLIRKQGGRSAGMPPALQFVLSMVFVILAGTGMLLMPNSTVNGIGFVDALFTSTSAVTITGLSSVNFYDVFSLKGQIIIVCLMQVGGFGVMTFAYVVAMIAGQGLSLRDRVLFRDLFDDSNMNQAVSFVRNIVLMTLGIELTGAILLYLSWEGMPMDLGGRPLWWHATFHAVSGFCNAGFSSLPEGLYSPGFVWSKAGQGVIMLLVISGGLGFNIYYEIRNNVVKLFQQKKRGIRSHIIWTPYFKLVCFTTIILIFGGALALFSVGHTGSATMSMEDKLWLCLYDSVIARTAGFNYTNIGSYLPSGILILCALMVIGGSPGGTAGGVRTTVAAVATAEVWRVLRGRKDIQFFNRSIAPDVIDRCLVTVVVAGIWIGGMTILCSYFDPETNALFLFFENCSAFATAGLSCGITPELSVPSKYIIMISMIAGRAGLFLFLMALAGRPKKQYIHYPTVRIPLT